MGNITLKLSAAQKLQKLQNHIRFMLVTNPSGIDRASLITAAVSKIPWATQQEIEAALAAMITGGRAEEK